MPNARSTTLPITPSSACTFDALQKVHLWLEIQFLAQALSLQLYTGYNVLGLPVTCAVCNLPQTD